MDVTVTQCTHSCAVQFETDISACMCRIHQSSCTLFVGGGGHSSAFVEGAGHTFDTIFEHFLCLLWEGRGGGGGEGGLLDQ